MTVTSPKNEITKMRGKFVQDLQTYFPEVYKIWVLFDSDDKYRQLLDGMYEMKDQEAQGSLEIIYQHGMVNYINMKKQLIRKK